MSTATTRPSGAGVGSRSTIVVEWAIARDAVRSAQPDFDLPASSRRGTDVVLSVAVQGSSCRAELRDSLTGVAHPIEIGAVRVEAIRADEFTHIVVSEGSDELLSATVRDQSNESRLLYAHTALLARLGIRGGRYARPMLGV
ncbi:MAG: hypothetical protein AAFY46_01120 [Planctomycetota bacterium]